LGKKNKEIDMAFNVIMAAGNYPCGGKMVGVISLLLRMIPGQFDILTEKLEKTIIWLKYI